MTVQLTSLRVTADMDASKYVAGMNQKVAADQKGAASSKAVEVSVLSAKKRMEDMGVSATRLARDTIAGYRDTERFARGVLNLGRALELGQFSANQAAASLDGLYRKYGLTANAAELAAAGHLQLADAVRDANARFVTAEKSSAMMAVAANQNIRSTGAFSTQLRMASMQLSQVAQQTSATGNFMQALAIQLPDLALGFGTVGIALGILGGILLQTDMAIVGVQYALNGLADILPTIAPYAAAAAAGLALLYAPAILGGITLLSEMILGLTARLAGLAIGFAMANPVGAFVAGFAVAATAATIFRDELAQVLGVDIVGYAKDGVNLIIGSFYAAYEDIKFLWNNLPQVLGAAAIGAANAVISAMERMINAATGLLNGLIGGVNSALSQLPGGLQIGTVGDVSFGQIENPYASGLTGAIADRNAAVQGAFGRDYLGDFGGAITSMASGAAERIRALAAGLGAVDEEAKKAGGSLRKAADKDPWDGLTKSLQQAAEFLRDLTGGIINDLRSGLEQGKSFWEAFGTAAKNALTKITDTLLNEVLDALFQVNSVGGSGGGGGILGTLIGGLFGGSTFSPGASAVVASGGMTGLFADGAAFSSGNVIPFARGGVVTRPTLFPMANGTGLMGEAGPESIMPLRRLPSGRLGVEATGGGAAAAQGGPLVNVQVINNASNTRVREDRRTGPDGREMRRIIIEEVKGEMAAGGFDGVMTGRYGASPQRVAR